MNSETVIRSPQAKTPIMTSSLSWDSIPLLALNCVLNHLEVNDAMAATATCHHWRSALLMYEGRRVLLKLPLMDLEKSNFLVGIFKKHTQRLHIYIDMKVNEELNTFMCCILPQFMDSINLQEIVFVGPSYVNVNKLMMPVAHLRRVITETLAYKHAHVLETLAMIGCDMSVVEENDRFVNSQMEFFSKPLTFQSAQQSSPIYRESMILSRSNVNMMMFSNVKHIVFEYDLISTEALITLSKLDNLRVLSLNFTTRELKLPVVDWGAVNPLFTKGLDVAVNLINLLEGKMQNVIGQALHPDMPVTSIKVMFCRNFYMKLILHITQTYGSTLTEFVYADPPTIVGTGNRLIRTVYGETINAPYNRVNPFIYLSWQCHNLQKLVIHGYWICEYDLLGVTRLRPGLDLVASSIFDSTSYLFELPPGVTGGNVLRVLNTDDPPRVHPVNKSVYMSRLNEVQARQLTPKDWIHLPAGLKLNATRKQVSEYFVSEILEPLGIT